MADIYGRIRGQSKIFSKKNSRSLGQFKNFISKFDVQENTEISGYDIERKYFHYYQPIGGGRRGHLHYCSVISGNPTGLYWCACLRMDSVGKRFFKHCRCI